MALIASSCEGEDLPVTVLAHANDRASGVRCALACLLRDRPSNAHLPTALQLTSDDWSSASLGEPTEYPIARVAAEAVAKSGPLDFDSLRAAARVALNTKDREVQRILFAFLAEVDHGKIILAKITVQSRHVGTRAAAAWALIHKGPLPDHAIAALCDLTGDKLLGEHPVVAAPQIILMATECTFATVRSIGQVFAARPEDRIKLVLLGLAARQTDQTLALGLAALLPIEHAARHVVATGTIPDPDEGGRTRAWLDALDKRDEWQRIVRAVLSSTNQTLFPE
jgi:hypothetical protein